MCCLGMGHTQSQCVRQTSKKVWVAKKTIVQQLEPPKQNEGNKELWNNHSMLLESLLEEV